MLAHLFEDTDLGQKKACYGELEIPERQRAVAFVAAFACLFIVIQRWKAIRTLGASEFKRLPLFHFKPL